MREEKIKLLKENLLKKGWKTKPNTECLYKVVGQDYLRYKFLKTLIHLQKRYQYTTAYSSYFWTTVKTYRISRLKLPPHQTGE